MTFTDEKNKLAIFSVQVASSEAVVSCSNDNFKNGNTHIAKWKATSAESDQFCTRGQQA